MLQTVYMKLSGIQPIQEGKVNLNEQEVWIDGNSYRNKELSFDIPITGTIYGTLLNYRNAYTQLKEAMYQEPYQAPPQAPVLYIKPQNTLIAAGSLIPIPEEEQELDMGAALGVVIGKTASKIDEFHALDFVEGYTIVNDVSIPHDSVYRPPVKEKARDGFCPVGPWIMSKTAVHNPNELEIRVLVNGELRQKSNTNQLIRSVEKLLADITEFMTLAKGDVLLVGVPENPPRVKAKDHIHIEIDQIGVLENTIATEKASVGGRL
ncbi:2-hydroxyhepta-2,4-diene-1,7-dioate isomerase [Virgibacillus pantothenticus]|uniref:4-hydroxyphenylacetate isomerase n=3 Tax=Virgibacillus pantothenticus TaxID=1473 RepID=A0A0L0QMQ8_VIRPA|nr:MULTISPECIES: fumarylacetoacetate hydrolase family protein [Virgibacillus]API93619.1 4-hydroxyphenylacetate isomerase [Virgibacillus sp. 6R]KNE19910.1 4-hydroxyphenylacetate isomerase [Virgibacillus pantothenticus]MBS7429988.1 fumarylacetoacetate hydrolase family protein [Virgibacillus sp. 19R1-5]MBU8564914.1 fumarylacetoacetate hydrolase family protein [Virgibacillus pantothenticus]MBU8599222.1 fumarylacetoacetate hydrolase family protein [Virgibacillus pantothenticus]